MSTLFGRCECPLLLGQSVTRKAVVFLIIVLWVIAFSTLRLNDFYTMIPMESESNSLSTNHNETHKDCHKSSHSKSRTDDDNDDDHNLKMEDYPFLISSVEDRVSGELITCDPLKYKYFRMILHELEHWFNVEERERLKHRTEGIDSDFDSWCHHRLASSRRERVQILNGTVFVSERGAQRFWSGNDREGYTGSVLLYLKWLMSRYGDSLPSTDFVWHFHDVKLGQVLSPSQFLWTESGSDSIPYFYTDAEVTWKHNDNAAHILFGVSRNFMKYHHFGEHIYSDWKRHRHRLKRKGDRINGSVLNFSNKQRVADYLEYKEWMEDHHGVGIEWNLKKKNKALFVGGMSGEIRPKFFELMLNDSLIRNLTADYFDVIWSNAASLETLSISEQMEYRFIVVLNGNSVRDGMLYQMQFDAVMLKQRTSIYEFWHFDLRDGRDVVFFENILHLIAIVTNMVDHVHGFYLDKRVNAEKNRVQFNYFKRDDVPQRSPFNAIRLRQIARSSTQFAKHYLEPRSVDCFMLNMLTLYNHYLFDTESLRPSQAQCAMTPLRV